MNIPKGEDKGEGEVGEAEERFYGITSLSPLTWPVRMKCPPFGPLSLKPLLKYVLLDLYCAPFCLNVFFCFLFIKQLNCRQLCGVCVSLPISRHVVIK